MSEDPRRVTPVAEAVMRRGVPFNFTLDYSHVLYKIGNDEELDVAGMRDDVHAGRVVLDPFEPGNLVDEWLALGIVRWMQVRAAVPNGPRNAWARHDPDAQVAALPRYPSLPVKRGDPGRGILYPFMKPAPGEWHSPGMPTCWSRPRKWCARCWPTTTARRHRACGSSRPK
ncbi:hypothetical protein [Pigmentiphaga litoralis]|uniref:hypothetical protein n=1 Tax=Pigmentiphaga litoralis TaxID=516702 RepID=UPI003B435DF4